MAVEIAAKAIATAPKQMASFLFFSDGVPSLAMSGRGFRGKFDSLAAIASAIIKLTEIFQHRMFSILLGSATANEQCPRNANPDQCPTPLKFVTAVAGSADRVRHAEEASELKDSLLSFLK
jgi:hypothetical protein